MKRLRAFFTKKRIIWSVIVLLIVLLIARGIFGRGGEPTITTEIVKKMDVRQTVLVTGQVVSQTDLSLGFQSAGIVRQVLVKEGSRVGAGQTLAILDQGSVVASLKSAQGALAQAKANYDKIAAGASNEDVAVSQAAVRAAQITLQSAYATMLNSGLTAVPASTNSSDGTITVSGTYTGTAQGDTTITTYGSVYDLKGLDVGYANIVRGKSTPIGTHGLFLTFSTSGSFNNGDTWKIVIPNTQAATYLTNYSAYQAAQAALDQAKAALALKQAAARPEDLAAAQAQVLSAQAQVDAAQVAVNNTVLRAPSAGTITKVDIRVGEQATALQGVMVLQDVGNLHAEANVSEADIAALKEGQDVDYTFDALGPDQHFKGKVQNVNPASTVVSGIVNYKVTASVEAVPEIKPGMTANMTILVAEKQGIIAVPSNAILNKKGRAYVRIIDDTKTKTYRETEVAAGLNADGGLVEITSGLSEGQEVVIDIQE